MNILGILRGFPGLGRVVSGTTILETLRDKHGCNIEIISYLQGNRYLESRGYNNLHEAIPMDYCSIGLLPTNKMGVYIHQKIKEFKPDIVVIDGEPLILQSLKISYPKIKIVALLNPADVDNPNNDKESMDYFNALYSQSNLAIIHGLRKVKQRSDYKEIILTNTVIRNEIMSIDNNPSNNIYCVLGGGTVNVGHQFAESTIRIAYLCQRIACFLPNYIIHIICSSQNIFDAVNENISVSNVILHNQVLNAEQYYKDACLIITRSGRNTLSELAYLGIPAVSFVSGCAYRREEQKQNIESLNVSNIKYARLDMDIMEFYSICKAAIEKGKTNNKFTSGNRIVTEKILSL